MALRTLVLVDGSSDDARLDRLRQAVRDIEAAEPGGASVLSGDRAALGELEARLAADGRSWTRQSLAGGASRSAPMAAAPFLYTDEGRPDWGQMWAGFCELALFGGPSHRGAEDPVLARTAPATSAAGGPDDDAVAEIQRGIFETTGLHAEPADDGWLSIACDGPRMAAWMCASTILENVDARSERSTLFVPAHPSFQLTDEVKSVITVVAKVSHYWQAHNVTARRAALIAAADDQLPEIAREYHEVLTAWGRARAARDWQSARDLHDRMHLLTDQLALSADGRAAVEACLDDPDVWVRLWTATEGLAWAPDRCRPVLEEIRDAKATAAIDATWAIRQFDLIGA